MEEEEPRTAIGAIAPEELDQVPEHLDDTASGRRRAGGQAGGPLRFARMTGSSIAGRDAAGWVTDFLNAAYYRRPVAERDVDDLRLAFAILTTYWYRRESPRRLRLTDLRAFHRAYGTAAVRHRGSPAAACSTASSCWTERVQLLGDWFPDGLRRRRPARLGDRLSNGGGARLPTTRSGGCELARLGELTPESGPPERQTWHTYPPVEDAVGRGRRRRADRDPRPGPTTPARSGASPRCAPAAWPARRSRSRWPRAPSPGRPIFTRGYVTITRLVTPDDPAALRTYFDELEAGLADYGENEPRAVPEGGEPVVGFDLTTHEGHFMGAGHNRLILYTHEGRAWVRAAGTWDPMPWHVDAVLPGRGRAAQHAFWGEGDVARLSMLHQLALQVA